MRYASIASLLGERRARREVAAERAGRVGVRAELEAVLGALQLRRGGEREREEEGDHGWATPGEAGAAAG